MSDWQSAAPEAVAGLIAAAQQVDGPVVHDALVLHDEDALEVIVVAGSANRPDTPRQEINREWIEHSFSDPGYSDQEENFTVWSEIAVLDGNGDIAAGRSRAYEILRDWVRAIEADQTLGSDLIMRTYITSAGWKPREDAAAVSILLVGITCEANTSL